MRDDRAEEGSRADQGKRAQARQVLCPNDILIRSGAGGTSKMLTVATTVWLWAALLIFRQLQSIRQ